MHVIWIKYALNPNRHAIYVNIIYHFKPNDNLAIQNQ